MDQPENSSGGGNGGRRELQGPRPTPLKVRKTSHKIKKPPIPPSAAQPPQQPPPAPPRPPVIIYSVSPKVIHTNPSDFMNLVQRLTGPDPPSASSSLPSPAATFAALEKTKIPLQSYSNYNSSGYEYSNLLDTRVGGVLSPGPGGLLRPVPPALFSDPISPLISLLHQHQQDHFNALQQLQHVGELPSPATMIPPFLSPNPMLSPASIEFLARLLDQ